MTSYNVAGFAPLRTPKAKASPIVRTCPRVQFVEKSKDGDPRRQPVVAAKLRMGFTPNVRYDRPVSEI